jgi:TctA family transporter
MDAIREIRRFLATENGQLVIVAAVLSVGVALMLSGAFERMPVLEPVIGGLALALVWVLVFARRLLGSDRPEGYPSWRAVMLARPWVAALTALLHCAVAGSLAWIVWSQARGSGFPDYMALFSSLFPLSVLVLSYVRHRYDLRERQQPPREPRSD